MDPQLIEYFGFSQDPFVEGLPGQQFYNPKRKSVLAELHFWAEQGQHFLLVTGPQGSGRSTLATAFLATCATTDICLHLSINGVSDAGGLQYQVAQKLEVADDLLQILDRLVLLKQQDKTLYLVVDNAENLDDSALLFLLRLAQGSQGASAQVIVFAQDSILANLKLVSDNQSLYQQLALEAWDFIESMDYLNFRLTMAGKSVDLFSDQEQAAIYRAAEGWPGRLHEEAEALLYVKADSQPPERGKKSLELKKIGLALAALLILVGVTISLWNYSSNSTPSTPQTLEIPREASTLESSITPEAAWYLKQNSNHYTLQILATRSEAAAKNYINLHGTDYRYFIKNQQNNKLFVVTYGAFSSAEAAKKRADDVKASSNDQPWARTFGSIQQEIE